MKILILMSSARIKGNTDRLCDAFIKGANEKGHQTEKIYVHKSHIKPCIGCRACQKEKATCIQKDDMLSIYHKMLGADIIVYASPVYFYTWNAQMKALIDRTFAIEKDIHDKDFYLFATGLAPDDSYFQIIKVSFQKYIDCLRAGNNVFKGYLFGKQTGERDDIERMDILQEAYLLGKSI